jgi:hypothetical protein
MMMNNYFFGLGNGKVSDREAKRIQKAIDSTGRSAAFIRYDDPAEGPRYWFSAANFLAYSNNLKVVRAVNVNTSNNATESGGILIENLTDYTQNHNTGSYVNGAFAAKYPPISL